MKAGKKTAPEEDVSLEQGESQEREVSDIEIDLPKVSPFGGKKSFGIIAGILVATFLIYQLFFGGETAKLDKVEGQATANTSGQTSSGANSPSSEISPSGKSTVAPSEAQQIVKPLDADSSRISPPPPPPILRDNQSAPIPSDILMPPDFLSEIRDKKKREREAEPEDKSKRIIEKYNLEPIGGVQATSEAQKKKEEEEKLKQEGQSSEQSKQKEILEKEKKEIENRRKQDFFVIKEEKSFGGTTKEPEPKKGEKEDFIIVGNNVSIKKAKSNKDAEIQKIEDLENTVGQGKFLEAVLETAINSSLAGMVRAILSADVYGETGKSVLIPKGTRLHGQYESNVKRGQTRIVVNWTRVIRPDGVTLTLSGQGADQFGRAGIEGDVDNRFAQFLSSSMLLSFITLGSAVAVQKITKSQGQTQILAPGQNQISALANLNVRPADYATQQFTQTASDVARQLIGELSSTNPIIRVEQGTRVRIMVNQDISVPPFKKISIR